jgi:DNA-binding response OmpR family regulator
MNKILVADREAAICMLYAEELMEDGYDVVTVSDPKEFMQAVEAEHPDLILLDIWMVKDGNDALLRNIRDHLNGIPIILTTTYTPCKGHFASLGFDDIVMKSFDFSELKAKINCLLKGLTPLPAGRVQRYKNQEIPISNYVAWSGHDAHHCSLSHGPGESLRYSAHRKGGETSSWTSGYRPCIEAREDETGISAKSVNSGKGRMT